MKLSGWARLWIVASVIWWAGGAFYLAPKWPSNPGPDIPLKPGCELVFANPEVARESPLIAGMCENSRSWVEQRAAIIEQWDEFIPLFVLWIATPFAFLILGLLVRWIAVGFAPATAKKSLGPNPPDSA